MNIELNKLPNAIIKTVKSDDTIVAIATPPGFGGVGIVRVSGPLSLLIASTLSQRTSDTIVPRQAIFTSFFDNSTSLHTLLDQGLLLYFKAPTSFTGEDIVEFQVHGSPVVLDRIVRVCIMLGARLARPGEFSERAFLNGKIDLTQAEAIADLIHARSEQAARSALRSLQGKFSHHIHHALQQLIDVRVWIESSLDFSDEEIDFLQKEQLLAKIIQLQDTVKKILETAAQAVLWIEGVTLVLAGKPNVGKSSLLNALVARDAAIVTDIPGTTRDIIRENFQWQGVSVHVLDTAGLRETDDRIEQEGVKRTRQALIQADVVFWVMDSQDSVATNLLAAQHIEGVLPIVPRLLVKNKIDLVGEQPGVFWDTASRIPIVSISVKNEEGLLDLGKTFKQLLQLSDHEPEFSARMRHVDALNKVLQHVTFCEKELSYISPHWECAAEELHIAQNVLNEITGEFRSDDLLGKIFSTFCIGK